MSASRPHKLDLDPTTEARLQRLSEARRRSPCSLMRQAIEQYVDREEAREQFRQEAIAAWNDYQNNGFHLTGEEVDAWLARLEAGEDVEPPPPHT